MQTGEGELGSLLLHAVLAAHGVHAQTAFDHQTLTDLNPVLKVLSKTSPADHLELTRRIIRTQAIELNGHLRNWSLVVLGVTHLRRLQHLYLQQAMVHRTGHGQGATS